MTRDTAFLLDIVSIVFHLQETSRVSFTLQLSPFTRMQLYRRLQHIATSGSLRLVTRLHSLLALAQAMSVRAVAAMLDLVSKPFAIPATSFSGRETPAWCTNAP